MKSVSETSKTLVVAERLCKRFLTKRFGRSDYVTAVDRVSLSIDRGKTLALVGESGSGKSTVARLMRLVSPDSGNIFFNGHDLSHLRRVHYLIYVKVFRWFFKIHNYR